MVRVEDLVCGVLLSDKELKNNDTGYHAVGGGKWEAR